MEKFDIEVADSLVKYFDRLYKYYSKISNNLSDIKDRFYNANSETLKKLEEEYFNYKLQELVTKPYERKKVLEYNNSLVQNTDPIYLEPYNRGFFAFRTHFYSPSKYIFGQKTDTFIFNIILVLLSTFLLYGILYFELLSKVVSSIDNLKLHKKKL